MQGVVRAVSLDSGRLQLRLSLGGERFPVTVGGESAITKRAGEIIDAVVRISGVCRTYFNGQRQLITPGLYCAGMDAIEVLEPASPPEKLPSIQIKDLLTYPHHARPGRRVKVHGITTFHSPEGILIVQDASCGLTIRTNELGRKSAVALGDEVEVLGFPTAAHFNTGAAAADSLTALQSNPTLDDSIVYRVLSSGLAPEPESISAAEAASGKFEARFVSLRASVLEDVRKGLLRTLWLQSGAALFEASQPMAASENFTPLPAGTEAKVSGICMARGPLRYREHSGWTATSFDLLVPSAGEIKVLRSPSWWTLRRVFALLGIVAACLAATVLWVRALRRRVIQQTALISQQISDKATLQERNRIARELHDTLAQGFAATAFQLEALSGQITDVSSKAHSHLNIALTMVRHSLAEARRSVDGLREEDSSSRDLPHALQAAGDLLVANTPVAFDFACSGRVHPITPKESSHLLRIGQEAVANAMRHANPRRILMELHYKPDSVRLKVEDDGKGFTPASDFISHKHYGLRGMAERAEEIGAALHVESKIGKGTVIIVDLRVDVDDNCIQASALHFPPLHPL